MDNNEIVAEVILAEVGEAHLSDGAYHNDPADPGSCTKWGITARGVAPYWNHEATPEQIEAIGRPEAEKFYLWLMETSGVGKITNDQLRWFVFDAAVHMGNAQAVKLLQRALGVKDDGVLGPVTLAAAPYLNSVKVCRLFLVEQALFYARLANKNLTDADKDGVPDQLEFLPGYMNRWATKARIVA